MARLISHWWLLDVRLLTTIRLKNLLKDDRIWTEPILCKWPDGGKMGLRRKRFILAIFLLEELSLRMEENLNPMLNRLGAGFYDFINELPKALEALEVTK